MTLNTTACGTDLVTIAFQYFSLCDLPSFLCFSIPFPYLSFCCLTSAVLHPLISVCVCVCVCSRCSPSYLCQIATYSPVLPP